MLKRISILLYSCLLVLAVSCNNNTNNSSKENTIVIQNYYYAKPGKEKEVLEWRIHACDVLKKIGVRPGRVMKCVKRNDYASPTNMPDVIWIGEYPDQATIDREWDLVRSTGKFEPVMEHMATLVRDFKRIRSEVQK